MSDAELPVHVEVGDTLVATVPVVDDADAVALQQRLQDRGQIIQVFTPAMWRRESDKSPSHPT
jgi:hypothetical protein